MQSWYSMPYSNAWWENSLAFIPMPTDTLCLNFIKFNIKWNHTVRIIAVNGHEVQFGFLKLHLQLVLKNHVFWLSMEPNRASIAELTKSALVLSTSV